MAVWLVGGFLAVALAAVAPAYFWVNARKTATDAGVPVTVRRHIAIWRWSGIAVGALAALAAAVSGTLGVGLLLSAPVFGACVLAGVLAGELSVRAPTGRTRRASIAVRHASDYIPRNLACCVATAAVGLGALLTMTTLMGSADSLGNAGRTLSRHCSAALTESDGPWLGSFYSVPVAIMILTGLTAAAIAMRQIVRRSRPGDPAALASADDILRSRAAYTVTGACGVFVTVPLIASSLITAAGLLGISCRPTWWTAAAWAVLALVPVWAALLAWSGLAVLAPPRHNVATTSL
ncbi:MAG TPA: hypothetical protein VGH53_14670 [Streptosporangiaceae bacterium]